MAIRKTILIFFSLLLAGSAYSQREYWVFFTDKAGVDFDPYGYFDQKAIDRRIKHGLPLNDFTDRPVCKNYIDRVSELVDSVSMTTRWFNGVAVFAGNGQMAAVEQLPFVRAVEPMPERDIAVTAIDNYDTTLTTYRSQLLELQTKRMGIEHFEEKGITGKGVRIAIFDAGFPWVDVHPAFEHIRKGNRIMATHDFVRNKENVYKYSAHGTQVLACIAGIHEGRKIGLATDAEFLLARTEMALREPYSEEKYWLAAMEWADKNGAQVINSSLAYTYNRYFNFEMDGKKSLVARAANMAARKGMLVVNAAGNDGDKDWKYIGSPGDADSVLTVGGIDPFMNYHIDFSSFGPTSDKRMKPNVSAIAHVVAPGRYAIKESYGTSFASPLVAGFAACVLQLKPELTNMELYRQIEQSGDLYPYYDYAHGFGVPDAAWFTESDAPEKEPTFEFSENKYAIKIEIKEAYYQEKKKIQSDLQTAVLETLNDIDYLYYHVQNNKGYLSRYLVVQVDSKNPLIIYPGEYAPGEIVRVHYKGYTATYKF